MTPPRFEELAVDDVRPLRTRVLRPHLDASELAKFDGDEADDAHHFGLVEGDTVVAVVSYLPAPPPEGIESPTTRLRGMAVREDRRGEGLGTRLLRSSLIRMAARHPRLETVWCQARSSAADFYAAEGFERHGEVFERDRIGEHVVMWREMPVVLA